MLATVADGVSAVREALALQPDVLFFDIRMPGQSGPEAFEATLTQLRGLLAQGAAPAPAAAPALTVLQVGVGQSIQLVAVQDVLYFAAADKYLRVLTAGREYLLRISLKELLPQLDPQQFWQIHRGTVVQVAHIAAIQRDETGRTTVLLKQRSETLAVSRLYAGRFRAMKCRGAATSAGAAAAPRTQGTGAAQACNCYTFNSNKCPLLCGVSPIGHLEGRFNSRRPAPSRQSARAEKRPGGR